MFCSAVVFFWWKTDINRFQNMCVCSLFESLLVYVDFCFWFRALGFILLCFFAGGRGTVSCFDCRKAWGDLPPHVPSPFFSGWWFLFFFFSAWGSYSIRLHEMTI